MSSFSKIKHYIDRIKQGRIREIAAQLHWMSRYSRPHLFSIIFYTALGLTGTLTGLLSSLVSRDLVDIITGRRTGELLKTFILIIMIQLLSTAISQLSSYISTKINIKIDNYIKADVYDRIMSTEWESLTKFHSGELMVRWSADASMVSSGVLNLIPNFIVSFFKFGAALYMVVRYDWTFALFALASVPISYLASKANLRRLRKSNMSSMELNAKMSSFTQESFTNYQTIKAFDMLKLYSHKLRDLQKENTDLRMKYQRISIVNSIILTLVSLLVTYSTYGWGIYKVWNNSITYGTMTMFLSLSTSLSGTAQSLINMVPGTISVSNAIKRIQDMLELPKEDFSQLDEVRDFAAANHSEGLGLSVRNSSYTYATGTEVFDSVSFDAHPYEVVALVGPSGEGKTTMLRLLLSLIHSQTGSAYICAGASTPESTDNYMNLTASTRQLFAYVPQGNTMFSGTIAENMRNVKEDATDEEILHALELACARDFVEKLPEGINSLIGERGSGFSEGQAQRLSIARALLRNSPILLLDEATSALDPQTERKLLANIMQDTSPRTTILTTHRMSVLNSCTRVYSIHDKHCRLLTAEEISKL